MRNVAGLTLVAASLSACASLPDVEYRYHPAKAQAQVTVTQTLDCTADKKTLIVVNTPSVAVTYAADTTKTYAVKIKAVEGMIAPFTDSEMTFGFYEDGRLKSVNQSTTGQGEAVIKAALALATVLGGAAPAAPVGTLPICAKIDEYGKGKPVTLTYAKAIPDVAAALGQHPNLDPTQDSARLNADLPSDPARAQLQVKIGTAPAPSAATGARLIPSSMPDDFVRLTLQRTAGVKIEVTASGSPIWSGQVTVPLADTYDLPILQAALFGKETFALTLSEAGAVTSITYAKNSGAAGALNAATGIATASQPEATSAKVADVKAEADLIAQQQRLARCRSNPSQCQ